MSDIKMVIVVRKDLNMRKGKLAAQVAHAAMEWLRVKALDEEEWCNINANQWDWLQGDHTKIVVSVDSEAALLELVQAAKANRVMCCPITDLGFTEFHGVPTLTCAAFGPCESEELKPITGH